MVLLIVIAAALIVGLVLGWRLFAAETSPRAANALLGMLVLTGLVVWLLSNLSFDAGV